MAKTGYGKRLAADEDPHADADFAHLSPRDREIAVFVDHLDVGHAMGYKAIAAHHPRYGQQAVRTSMGRLTLAGQLRWIKEHITLEDDSMRWVTRTYWSRTRRSEEWWADFAHKLKGKDVTEDYLAGLAHAEREEPREEAAAVDEAEPPTEDTAEQPGTAYETLAGLREADARMPLSDRDCHSLESLAAEWLARGATPHDITKALTDGLPPAVTNPGGLARKRLETKMPPQPPPKKAKAPQKAARRAQVTRVLMACGLCDADERTVEVRGGLCDECIALIEAEGPVCGAVPDTFLPGPRREEGGGLVGADEVIGVTERVDILRRAAGLV
ncbi:hypothetical protein ABZ464_27245 [Streptomyces sp. NPDC005820]|uniref:hypothetical protein n=1 Tax=Streptomyces sp. NPDC005820 TaxID=3157069 RepID=UPI0034058A1B